MPNQRDPNSISGQIRHLLSTEASMTAAEVEEALGTQNRYIRQRLNDLRRMGHVQVVGIGKRGAHGPAPRVYGIESAAA